MKQTTVRATSMPVQLGHLNFRRSPADNAGALTLVAPTKFNPQVGWFIRGVHAVMESAVGREGFGTNDIGLSLIDQADHFLGLTGNTGENRPKRIYGINAFIAHKLDTKFDDGLPYGGNN